MGPRGTQGKTVRASGGLLRTPHPHSDRPEGGASRPLRVDANERWFEAVLGGPGESQDKGKETQEGLGRARGHPPRSLEDLLGLFSLVLAFPWGPLELHQTTLR